MFPTASAIRKAKQKQKSTAAQATSGLSLLSKVEEERFRNFSKELPYELFFQILELAAEQDQWIGANLLGLSKDIYERLSNVVYARVTLSTVKSVELFAALLREKPDAGRKVKSLWIGEHIIRFWWYFHL